MTVVLRRVAAHASDLRLPGLKERAGATCPFEPEIPVFLRRVAVSSVFSFIRDFMQRLGSFLSTERCSFFLGNALLA
jgi:hypothetical protein